MSAVRYATTIPFPRATVSITRQGTLIRYFRASDEDGQVEFYDYELPYGYKWDVKYRPSGQSYWNFHEAVELLEGFDEGGVDIAPPDGSTYSTTYTGLD